MAKDNIFRLIKYLTQYRFKDMFELIRNEKREPERNNKYFKDKCVIISGATSGIGLATSHLFASKGANLIFLNRNKIKSDLLEQELISSYNIKVETIIVDFNSLEEIRKCANDLLILKDPIDVIIHNTGVFNTKKQYSMDGIEMVYQVNHLGAFLINYSLKEKLKKENRVRIINVNSEGHRFAFNGVHLDDLDWRRHHYTGLKSYGASKTAQFLTMYKFSDYFKGTNVTINSMHPGNVVSNMGNNNGKLYRYFKDKFIMSKARDPKISAQALLYLSLSQDLNHISGKFFNLTTMERPAPHGRDLSCVETVWNNSIELCGLK